MQITNIPILSLIIFLPAVGALLLLFLRSDTAVHWTALVFTLVSFALTIPLLAAFDSKTHTMQFTETIPWVPSLGINYSVGVDGISILFVFLTALLGWICVLASWKSIETKVKEFMICLLVMQSLMLGVFCAMDLFLFYVFWEAMLIPMYLIIGVWGGKDRVYAAVKFFLYTLVGSLLFLVGIMVLYFQGGHTFDILTLMEGKYSFTVQAWVFIAFFVAFAVKVPMVPFHTWLPDAHVQAPTAGSIILAGVLLKMGAYGFLRFSLPMLPDASNYFALMIQVLSAVAIIYGGFLALAQEDIKKLVAYSSVSHMGFITLGLFTFNTNGMEGAVLQMFNHGITTGALFLLIGLIYERTQTRIIAEYGGLMKVVPIYGIVLCIFTLSSIAVPGTNSFIGELLILVGAFSANKAIAAAAVAGAVLSAAYMLGLFRQMALGPTVTMGGRGMWDVDAREILGILALLIFVFWIGFYPLPFLDVMHVSVEHLLEQSKGAGGAIQ